MRFAALFVLLLTGCVSTGGSSSQEPTSLASRLPSSGNQVTFGASIASPDSQALALKLIDDATKSRLPGWSFEVVQYPVRLPPGTIGMGPNGEVDTLATSTRDPIHKLIVLSWWPKGTLTKSGQPKGLNMGTWGMGDAPWEISHAVDGTDDDGRPYLPYYLPYSSNGR